MSQKAPPKESARREAILDAATRLFHHYGPSKTTVADIAREARVGVGTVYLEFRSKDAILSALSWIRHARVLSSVERAWGDGKPAARCLGRALDARFEAFLGCAGDGAHGIDLVTGSCAPIEEAQRTFREQEIALFARFLRQAATAGDLAVSDPERDARAILVIHRAFEPPHLYSVDRDELRAELMRVRQIILEGLLPRGAKRR